MNFYCERRRKGYNCFGNVGHKQCIFFNLDGSLSSHCVYLKLDLGGDARTTQH